MEMYQISKCVNLIYRKGDTTMQECITLKLYIKYPR